MKCRICDNTQGNTVLTAREMMHGRRDPHDYMACGACGTLQIRAVPENLRDYYGEGYYSMQPRLDEDFADPALRSERGRAVRQFLTRPGFLARRMDYRDMRRPLWSLRRLKPRRDARILDVGCGVGRLPYLLALGGWTNVEGAEPFLEDDIHYAHGPRIRRGGLEDMPGGWDIIMFHHAFEHVPDPLATLTAVAARLTPRGRVLLRIPVADSEAYDRYGVDWVQLDAPRHLFLFTRRGLRILAAKAGLTVDAVDDDSYDLQFWGSEQYRRDIPLFDEQSYRWGAGPSLFPPEQLLAWRQDAERLNRAGRGDQAAFYLRRA